MERPNEVLDSIPHFVAEIKSIRETIYKYERAKRGRVNNDTINQEALGGNIYSSAKFLAAYIRCSSLENDQVLAEIMNRVAEINYLSSKEAWRVQFAEIIDLKENNIRGLFNLNGNDFITKARLNKVTKQLEDIKVRVDANTCSDKDFEILYEIGKKIQIYLNKLVSQKTAELYKHYPFLVQNQAFLNVFSHTINNPNCVVYLANGLAEEDPELLNAYKQGGDHQLAIFVRSACVEKDYDPNKDSENMNFFTEFNDILQQKNIPFKRGYYGLLQGLKNEMAQSVISEAKALDVDLMLGEGTPGRK